jgi:isopentenyl diphosphate isomerase/L-lactate dehydrogenase-like FMN-dependent dehydrogenase
LFNDLQVAILDFCSVYCVWSEGLTIQEIIAEQRRRSGPANPAERLATETSRATIEALPEVVAEVGNRIPVFIDGGIRRGTDAFKALALGAKAIGIGRPYLWGLGAFGQAGVDRVIEIPQGELKLAMGNCGTQTVSDINRAYVATPNWKI